MRFLPKVIKAALILLGFAVLRLGYMRSFQPHIVTDFGCELAGGPVDSILNAIIFYRGIFEPNLSKLIPQIVKKGDVCMDVGANTGYFTLMMAQSVGDSGKVLAVEASPGNVRRLRKNISLNQLDERVEVIEAACSDTTGEAMFYVHRRNDMWSRLRVPRRGEPDYWLVGTKHWRPVVVPTRNLVGIAGELAPKVTFIKLDIEGAESLILEAIPEVFTHPRLTVALEAKPPFLRESLESFRVADFRILDLRNDYRWLVSNERTPITTIDYEEVYGRNKTVDVLLTRAEVPGACRPGGSHAIPRRALF